jgi:hypothetical protein
VQGGNLFAVAALTQGGNRNEVERYEGESVTATVTAEQAKPLKQGGCYDKRFYSVLMSFLGL